MKEDGEKTSPKQATPTVSPDLPGEKGESGEGVKGEKGESGEGVKGEKGEGDKESPLEGQEIESTNHRVMCVCVCVCVWCRWGGRRSCRDGKFGDTCLTVKFSNF